MSELRLFIGIKFSAGCIALLSELSAQIRELLRELRVTGRVVSPEQFHLTLKFLGSVSPDKVDAVKETLSRVAAISPGRPLNLSTLGCFPTAGPVRIIWLGLDDQDGFLSGIARELDEQLSSLGYTSEERQFTPHITIARIREDRSKGALRSRIAQIAVPHHCEEIRSVQLLCSELHPSGSRYHLVSSEALP